MIHFTFRCFDILKVNQFYIGLDGFKNFWNRNWNRSVSVPKPVSGTGTDQSDQVQEYDSWISSPISLSPRNSEHWQVPKFWNRFSEQINQSGSGTVLESVSEPIPTVYRTGSGTDSVAVPKSGSFWNFGTGTRTIRSLFYISYVLEIFLTLKYKYRNNRG